jgi:hypothetical protein
MLAGFGATGSGSGSTRSVALTILDGMERLNYDVSGPARTRRVRARS